MRYFRALLALIAAACCCFPAFSFAIELPCWDKASCYNWNEREPKFPTGFVEKRPNWHKQLDDLQLKMRQDADYSILFDSQKDRVPFIHTPESQRAVDEFAGSVVSSIASPLAYRLPLFPYFDNKRREVNATIQGAMPKVQTDYYSVHFQPRVDFSQTNPASLDIKVRDGRELGIISVRIREAEVTAPVIRGVSVISGYSFRDHAWYAYLAGKIPLPW